MRHKVKLYANNELPIPAIEIEADDLYEAAALGLRHFRALGRELHPDATVNIESEAYGELPRRVKQVLDWLRDSEDGRAFTAAKRLHSLLD